MGIIQRQSIKHTIVTYIGIAIGTLSSLFIYPLALEAYGLVQTLIAAASFVTPVVLLGTTLTSVRFFPVFRTEDKRHHGLLGLLLLVAIGGILLFTGIFPFIKGWLTDYFFQEEKSPWYREFVGVVLPLTYLIVFTRLLTIYSSNFRRIVVPVILEEFLIKITLPLLILAFAWEWLRINWVVNGVLITYGLSIVGLAAYIWSMGHWHLRPDWKFLDRKLVRNMRQYSGFAILNGLGTKAAFYVDTLMVSALIDLKSAGIYNIALFLSGTIAKPIRSVIGIAQPIIAEALEKDDLDEVRKIYQRSSLNLLIFGVFLFVGIWVCLDDIFRIMPNTEAVEAGKWVVILLCFSRLVDLGTSVNNEIINYSRWYRFNFYVILVFSVFNIAINLYLIPRYGMIGAALATLVSLSLFNLVKLTFIQWRFGMQPFTRPTLLILGVGTAVWAIGYYFPSTDLALVNLLIKGSLVTLLYPLIIYKMDLSEEYNGIFRNVVNSYLPFAKGLL